MVDGGDLPFGRRGRSVGCGRVRFGRGIWSGIGVNGTREAYEGVGVVWV